MTVNRLKIDFAKVCILLTMSLTLFFFQTASATHIHDHHDDAPEPPSCDVCIQAHVDEEDLKLEPDDDGGNDPVWFFQVVNHPFFKTNSVEFTRNVRISAGKIRPSPQPRAPPL